MAKRWNWTPEIRKELLELWNTGKWSTSQLGEKFFGNRDAKNAVVGFLHRTAATTKQFVLVKNNPSVVRATHKSSRKRKAVKPKKVVNSVFIPEPQDEVTIEPVTEALTLHVPAPEVMPEPEPILEIQKEPPVTDVISVEDQELVQDFAPIDAYFTISEPAPKTIMTLRDDMCRWPMEANAEGDREYCCKKVHSPGRPWCPEHHKIAFAPSRR